MGNLSPRPRNQGWENGAFWRLTLDLGGTGFAVPSYFVQDCRSGNFY